MVKRLFEEIAVAIDVRGEVGKNESLEEAEARANGVMKRLRDAFVALVDEQPE